MNPPTPAPSPLSRRAAIGALMGFGAAAVLAACGSDTQSTSTTAAGIDPASSATPTSADASDTAASTSETAASTGATAATSAATAAACDPIPEETGGPYPGDGTNGPDILSVEGVVRADIRTSIGTASSTADGVPLTVNLSLVDSASGCAPLANAAVYLWHCDREGNYSMYSAAAAAENYLRGVQVADSAGSLSFTTIFPAAYSGRWPHIHFEIYESVDAATGGGRPIATSQIALPQAVCEQVYATAGYEQSVRNLSQTSLASDNVFGDDDGVHQLATMTGDTGAGLVAALTVPV